VCVCVFVCVCVCLFVCLCVRVCACRVLSRNVSKDYLKTSKNIMEESGRVLITRIPGPLPYLPLMLP
jgi:hypothetical protein